MTALRGRHIVISNGIFLSRSGDTHAYSNAGSLRRSVMRLTGESEETDQNRQALLEIYCAVVLGTPYNDFGTH